MKIKRSFWERLTRHTSREVLEKDKNGSVTGKTAYRFDKYGNVVEQIDSSFDSANNRFIVQKDKTFSRCPDGSYDPDVTRYFDNQGRETVRREYDRDKSGMLECTEEKFVYTPTGKKTGSYLEATYDGGLWTKQYKEDKIYDSFGHIVQGKTYEYSSKIHGLVCVKDKKRVRNADGTYDPKETSYYDLEGRLTRQKLYHREQTELGSTLFGDETEFSYKDGVQQASKKERLFLMDGNLWGNMQNFQSLIALSQAEKASKIQKLEAELAALKGEKPAEKPATDPQVLQEFKKRNPRD